MTDTGGSSPTVHVPAPCNRAVSFGWTGVITAVQANLRYRCRCLGFVVHRLRRTDGREAPEHNELDLLLGMQTYSTPFSRGCRSYLIIAFTLDNTMPGTKEERGLQHWNPTGGAQVRAGEMVLRSAFGPSGCVRPDHSAMPHTVLSCLALMYTVAAAGVLSQACAALRHVIHNQLARAD
jgi:hypothetical protein